MRLFRFGLLIAFVALTGCADWAMRLDGMEPYVANGIGKDDLKQYVLSKEDIEKAPPTLLNQQNHFDWPLMIALWKEAGQGAGEDCRAKDAFACLRKAAFEHRPAFAYTTDFWIDSAQGWGAAARADGTIIIFLFDGSPKGQVFPERAGWRLDYTVCKTLADEKSAKRVLCANPYFGRDKK
jgi:hypothetical protein